MQIHQPLNHWMQSSDELLKAPMQFGGGLAQLLVEHLYVASGHKTCPCALKQNAAHRTVIRYFFQHGGQVLHHLVVERIQALRTVEGDFIDCTLCTGENCVHKCLGYREGPDRKSTRL